MATTDNPRNRSADGVRVVNRRWIAWVLLVPFLIVAMFAVVEVWAEATGVADPWAEIMAHVDLADSLDETFGVANVVPYVVLGVAIVLGLAVLVSWGTGWPFWNVLLWILFSGALLAGAGFVVTTLNTLGQ